MESVSLHKKCEKYGDNLPLLRKSKEGDHASTEALVRLNAGLVKSIALRFLGRGYDMEDLIQTGNIGLLRAIRTFDEDRGCAFSTYAVPLIFGEIRRFLRDDGMIKVSRETKRLGAMLNAERERMSADSNGAVRLSEIAKRVGVSTEEAADALCAVSPITYLSDLLYKSEDSPDVESSLSDDDELRRSFDRLALSCAIEKLPEARRKIVILRFFRDMSQQKTAEALGISQVKVSREEKKILDFLRQELS